jgi:hypothetical protein
MILSIWAISCTSSRVNSTAPKVTPPDPYTADGKLVIKYIFEGETFTADGDGVYMPYWYWEKMFDYIVDTQAALKIADINSGKK